MKMTTKPLNNEVFLLTHLRHEKRIRKRKVTGIGIKQRRKDLKMNALEPKTFML
jgi:hypothetical protein